MKATLLLSLSASVALLSMGCSAFSIRGPAGDAAAQVSPVPSRPRDVGDPDGGRADPGGVLLDRRSAVSVLASMPAAGLLARFGSPPANAASDKGKVVVFGGSGWVGAHVAADLRRGGYRAVSVSRSAPDVQADRTRTILGATVPGAEYVSLDAASASVDDLASAMGGSVAVISCVGASPGSPNQRDGNGLVNARIVEAAKVAGVPKFVYVGVASSLAGGPAKFLLGEYFKGKAEAENSVVKGFGPEKSLIIKPAIIAGGTPGEVRPPGPPGVKPVDVDAVARLAVAGAVGDFKGLIDGNDDIAAIGS